MQGCDRYKAFVSPNQIQNQIRLVLLVLIDTKIQYHYGKMANFVSPNQIQIQIGLVHLVGPDTCGDTSQPWQDGEIHLIDRRRTIDGVWGLQQIKSNIYCSTSIRWVFVALLDFFLKKWEWWPHLLSGYFRMLCVVRRCTRAINRRQSSAWQMISFWQALSLSPKLFNRTKVS